MAQKPYPEAEVYCTRDQDHGLELTLDRQLIELCSQTLNDGTPKELELSIQNTDRATGTTLSHEVSKRFGADGLPADSIQIKFFGSAGQSLGAWLAPGITLTVEGDANDYVGKGLSGGKVIVYPPKDSTFDSDQSIVIGNVALYGAVKGEAYFSGVAAERFAVRNSGANAVVEGVGDHACEYMTGGRVVILGPTGRNLAAGMSGGVAYVFDPQDKLLQNCNLELVELEPVTEADDILELQELIAKHQTFTDSKVAQSILDAWSESLPKFKKVMPVDYKRALLNRKQSQTESPDTVMDAPERDSSMATSTGSHD